MKNLKTVALFLATVLVAGCDEDERLVQLAAQADQRQAEQNAVIAKQSDDVTKATRRLVEEQAAARRDAAQLQRDLHTERTGIDQSRSALDAERQAIAHERLSDSRMGAAITAGAMLVACLLPLVLGGYLLRGLHHKTDDAELTELLVAEFTTDSPLLLAESGVDQTKPALPDPKTTRSTD